MAGAADDQTRRVLILGPDLDLAFDMLTLLDGRTGSVLRVTHGQVTPGWAIALDSRTQRAFVTYWARLPWDPPPPAVHSTDSVNVIDTATGRTVGTIALRPGSRPEHVAVDVPTGRAFVMNDLADTVSVLDARSGAVLGSVAVGGSPVDDVGYVDPLTLTVDQRRGRIFVINTPAAGVLHGSFVDAQWSGSLGGMTFLRYQTAAGAVLSATEGSVSVLDAQSGHLLHTLRIGRHPIALAVDEATGRLFVVNTNAGCVPERDGWAWVPGAVRRQLSFLIPRPPRPTCDMPGTVTVIDTSHL